MSDRHDEFREWAGAYALGALEPAERREFEEHLAGCSSCSDEVRSLLPLHGLLAGSTGRSWTIVRTVAPPTGSSSERGTNSVNSARAEVVGGSSR